MKVLKREVLGSFEGTETVKLEVSAPHIAKKALPGQFIVLMVSERGERIPLTIVDTDKSGGSITIIFQVLGLTTGLLKESKSYAFSRWFREVCSQRGLNLPACKKFILPLILKICTRTLVIKSLRGLFSLKKTSFFNLPKQAQWWNLSSDHTKQHQAIMSGKSNQPIWQFLEFGTAEPSDDDLDWSGIERSTCWCQPKQEEPFWIEKKYLLNNSLHLK